MPDNTVFLETTAIIDYCKQSKSQIDEILEKYDKKVSAQFVRMEIKRGYFQNLVYLHNKLATYATFGEVMGSVRALSYTPHRHRLSTILESLEAFFKDPPEQVDNFDEYLRNECASHLRNQIRRVWNSIDKLVDEMLNPMDCFVDISPPRREGAVLNNKPRECVKSYVECKIKKFFEDNGLEFVKIRDVLKALPDKEKDQETKDRINALKEIIRLLPYATRRISNKEHNFRECWKCGDAILAVLAPPGSTVMTSNIKHYKPMCEAIGRELVGYRD